MKRETAEEFKRLLEQRRIDKCEKPYCPEDKPCSCREWAAERDR